MAHEAGSWSHAEYQGYLAADDSLMGSFEPGKRRAGPIEQEQRARYEPQRSKRRNNERAGEPSQAASASADRPKGKGRGRGEFRQGAEQPATLPHAVELTRRAALRLLQQSREQHQAELFVVEFPVACKQTRESLVRLANGWKQERPQSGPHPKGSLHVIQWKYIVNTWGQELSSNAEAELVTSEQKETHVRLLKFLSSQFETPNGLVNRFSPLGRKDRPPQDGPWLFSLGFNLTLQAAREQHERLRDLVAMGSGTLHVQGASIRHDRGSPDALERELRALRIE
jgi:hypothetical protein